MGVSSHSTLLLCRGEMSEGISDAMDRLRAAARRHKQLSAAHRRAAREMMQALADIEAALSEIGVKVHGTGGIHSHEEEYTAVFTQHYR